MMSQRPRYHGDPTDLVALSQYEEELREWEAAEAAAHLVIIERAEQEVLERGVLLTKAQGPTVLFGQGEPQESLGRDGQGYLDWTSGDIWAKLGGDWVRLGQLQGEGGPGGPPGNDGAPGAQGPPGADGADGAPGADGQDGAPGADGQDGADGADGADGNDWRVGSGAPSIIAGDEEGDLYLDTASGDVYQVQSSAWVLVANIEGPQGPPGADGQDGADGADGQGVPTGGTADQYLAKISSTNFDAEWRTFNAKKFARIGGLSGSHALSGTTYVDWATEEIEVGGAINLPGIGEDIDVEESGYYLIYVVIGIDTTSSSGTESTMAISAQWQRDEGAGFVNMGPTFWLHEYSPFMNNQTMQIMWLDQLDAGDVLRIGLTYSSGDDTLVIRGALTKAIFLKIEAAGPPA